MSSIRSEIRDGILIVTMSRGRANALNNAMIEELHQAVEVGENNDSVRGIVLTSDCPGFFSGGFDVNEVFQYDRATMIEFFKRFIDLYERLLEMHKPVVAAVNGHAFAGGAILALACDVRVMAEGNHGFAVNEIDLGVLPPLGFLRLAIAAAGTVAARELIMKAHVISPDEALCLGLANQLVEPSLVLDQALKRAQELAAKPPITFSGIKRSFNTIAGLTPAGSDHSTLDQFIEHWFSPECRAHRQSLVDSLQTRTK